MRQVKSVVANHPSGFFALAAAPRQPLAATAWPTSPHKTRVRGFRRRASGQTSRRGRCRSINTPSSRGCAYKTVSGRHEWLNRDPIQEWGGINLYDYVLNHPISSSDSYGLCGGNYVNPVSFNAQAESGVAAEPSGPTIGGPQGDQQISSALQGVLNNMNDNELPFWPAHVANLPFQDYDTGYVGPGTYTYTGTSFPTLQGRTFTGGDLNYIGVGEGFSALGFSMDEANSIAASRYPLAHNGAPISNNALTAMDAGYMAYDDLISQCPDSFETSENQVSSF